MSKTRCPSTFADYLLVTMIIIPLTRRRLQQQAKRGGNDGYCADDNHDTYAYSPTVLVRRQMCANKSVITADVFVPRARIMVVLRATRYDKLIRRFNICHGQQSGYCAPAAIVLREASVTGDEWLKGRGPLIMQVKLMGALRGIDTPNNRIPALTNTTAFQVLLDDEFCFIIAHLTDYN